MRTVPAPSNLPAALFHHASFSPEEPWLFRAEGWDWRWHSWGEIARRVQATAASLSAHSAGSHIQFPYTAQPDAVIQDLAIQAAGLVSVPSFGLALLPPPPQGPPPPFPPHRERRENRGKSSDAFPSPGEGGREGAGEGPGVRVRAGGGAVVLRNGEPLELSSADLIAMAARIQQQLQPAKAREIVVVSGSLQLAEERAMLAWATVAGSAVVLEPNPAMRVATAAWVRPTVFHGTAAELAGLRQWVEKEKRGFLRTRPRRPFRRLRTILLTGPDDVSDEDEAFWRGRGVRVLWLSGLATSENPIR